MGYLAERVPLVRLLRLDHPEGVAKEYKRTAGRRLGDCDLKLDDLDPRLARMNLKDAHHEAMLRKIEEEREWTPWNICDGEQSLVTVWQKISYLERWLNSLLFSVFSLGREETLLHL